MVSKIMTQWLIFTPAEFNCKLHDIIYNNYLKWQQIDNVPGAELGGQKGL